MENDTRAVACVLRHVVSLAVKLLQPSVLSEVDRQSKWKTGLL